MVQVETLKKQNAKYQDELKLSKEKLISDNQRISSLCQEM